MYFGVDHGYRGVTIVSGSGTPRPPMGGSVMGVYFVNGRGEENGKYGRKGGQVGEGDS